LTSKQGDLLDTIIGNGTPERRDLAQEFARFHAENEGVYRALVRLARQAKAAGHEHIGIKMLFEIVRWESLVGPTKTRGDFKLDNSLTAFYAREIMSREPDLAEFFETRRSIADNGT
jgi:hypothetical protein